MKLILQEPFFLNVIVVLIIKMGFILNETEVKEDGFKLVFSEDYSITEDKMFIKDSVYFETTTSSLVFF